jgi:hypothetical protein
MAAASITPIVKATGDEHPEKNLPADNTTEA